MKVLSNVIKEWVLWVLALGMTFNGNVAVLAADIWSSEQAMSQEIEAYIEERKETTASVSLGVYREGEVIYRHQSGWMDIDNQVPADQDSIYEWGSVSKVLVWVAVMQLVEAGRLDLSEDIRSYLPEDFQLRLTYPDKISLETLMNHQAGFQEITEKIEFEQSQDIPPLKELLLQSQPLQIYQPGTMTAYSNWTSALAAYIVECQVDQSFQEYVDEHIFAPLGMDKTSIKADWSDKAFVQEGRNKTKSYAIYQGSREDYGQAIAYVGLYPAGSCAGTFDDFLTFASQFTAASTPLFKKSETLAQMLTATSTYSDGQTGRVYHGLWSIDYGKKLVGHAGNTQGFSSSIWFDPDTKTGYAVMTNEAGETTYNYGLAELLYGAYPITAKSGADIAGVYANARTVDRGFARMAKYFAGILPIAKTEQENEFKIMIADLLITSLGQGVYRQDTQNGLAMNLISSDQGQKLEGYTSDYIRMSSFEIGLAIFLAVTMLLLILWGMIQSIRLLIKNFFKKETTSFAWKNQWALWAGMGISLIFFYFWLAPGSYDHTIVMICSILSVVFAVGILFNLVYQGYQYYQTKNKFRDLVSAGCYSLAALAGIFFQLYYFWA